MFTAALVTIAKTWEHPQCPLIGDWIKKMWDIYTVEYIQWAYIQYYSAIRKDEILPFATMWMDLENLMLSKISQSVKAGTI